MKEITVNGPVQGRQSERLTKVNKHVLRITNLPFQVKSLSISTILYYLHMFWGIAL